MLRISLGNGMELTAALVAYKVHATFRGYIFSKYRIYFPWNMCISLLLAMFWSYHRFLMYKTSSIKLLRYNSWFVTGSLITCTTVISLTTAGSLQWHRGVASRICCSCFLPHGKPLWSYLFNTLPSLCSCHVGLLCKLEPYVLLCNVLASMFGNVNSDIGPNNIYFTWVSRM